MPLDVNLTTSYQYNHEIYNGQMKGWLMEQASLFHRQIVFSYWNNWQFIARRWYKPIILNWGILRSPYHLWQYVFLFIALSSCCYTERSMNFFVFSVIIFKLKCNIKVEQEMAIQHSTVLRKKKNSLCNVTTCCVIVKGWISPSGERLTLYLPYCLWPAYYMYDNVINSSHCYRFIMYFSNLILYVY